MAGCLTASHPPTGPPLAGVAAAGGPEYACIWFRARTHMCARVMCARIMRARHAHVRTCAHIWRICARVMRICARHAHMCARHAHMCARHARHAHMCARHAHMCARHARHAHMCARHAHMRASCASCASCAYVRASCAYVRASRARIMRARHAHMCARARAPPVGRPNGDHGRVPSDAIGASWRWVAIPAASLRPWQGAQRGHDASTATM